MAYMTRTAQGAPCWVSLLVHDLPAAEHFYGSLLGWAFRPGSQRLGPYAVALKDDVPVAGIAAAARRLGMPVTWTAYFHVDSADIAAGRVRERGATLAVGPVPFGRGRVAWAADPAGAVFGIWEGEADPGWQVDRTAGAPAWIELRTGDAFAAAIFYGEVFGWGSDEPGRCDVGYEHDRVVLRVDGRTAAGLRGEPPPGGRAGRERGTVRQGGRPGVPDPRIQPRWHVYFWVDDVADVARHADALGGSVASPPADSPFGRVATLRDPAGGQFSVTARED